MRRELGQPAMSQQVTVVFNNPSYLDPWQQTSRTQSACSTPDHSRHHYPHSPYPVPYNYHTSPPQPSYRNYSEKNCNYKCPSSTLSPMGEPNNYSTPHYDFNNSPQTYVDASVANANLHTPTPSGSSHSSYSPVELCSPELPNYQFPCTSLAPLQATSPYCQQSVHMPTCHEQKSLEQRFSSLISSHKPISDWASQLYSFYTTERSRIANVTQYPPDNQHCQTQPPVVSSSISSLQELLERVEHSLKSLEDQKIYRKTPLVTRKPRATRRPPKHLNPTAQRVLLKWYTEHEDNPYPDAETVERLAADGKVAEEQVKKWFCNKRARSCNTRSLGDIVRLRNKVKHDKNKAETKYTLA